MTLNCTDIQKPGIRDDRNVSQKKDKRKPNYRLIYLICQ